MRSLATDILETALALHRAPGERFRLRERPLPPGTLQLIEIATGAPQALRTAAEELSEPEEAVLDASRFYLEQMLFADPNADAYRVLGVAPDTPTEEIRRHHRLLQRWLHPDRAQAGDAAVFATRVNQAWSQLRTPESRQAYDARLATAIVPGPVEATDSPVRLWQGDAPDPSVGRRSRWLFATALAACGVLVVLMYRQTQNVEPSHARLGTPIAEHGSALQDGGMEVDVDVGAAEAATAATAEHGSALQAALAKALEPAIDVLPDPEPVELPPPPAPQPHPPSPPPPVEPSHARLIAVAESAVAEHGSALQGVEETRVAASAAPTVKVSVSDNGAGLLAQRMQMAERRLGQVTAYLASSPDAAPLWNDASIAEQAAQLRQRFNRRNGCPEFDGEVWRLHRDNAHASAAWRCRSERGRLDVELVWREGMWLVRGIDLAPAA